MRLPPYLLVRESGFYFRIAIPKDLRPRYGKTEIRKTLNTHDRHVALLMAGTMSANVRSEFRALRSNLKDFPFIDLENMRQLKIGELQVGNTTLRNVDVDTAKPEEIGALKDIIAEAGRTAPLPSVSPPPATGETTPTTAPRFLSQLFPVYLRARRKAGKSETTLTEYKTAHDLLVEVIGDKSISHVSHDDANFFVDIIQQLPPNRTKVATYRDKTIEQTIEARQLLEHLEKERTGVEQDFTLNVRTVDKHIAACRAFFQWALDKGHIDGKNVFAKQKIQNKKERETDSEKNRVPFEADDLRKIFDPTNYRTRGTPHDFWIPLIGLYSGLRLNEIAQLHLTDICYRENIWTFDINDNEPDKRLKNRTAKRLVPIHSQLLELGFLDFFHEMQTMNKVRLFPTLSYTVSGGYARAPGKNFANYLDKIGITDTRKVFHSLRHTFNNTLKQTRGIDAEARSELMGHAHQSINSNVYTDVHRLPNKQAFIEPLAYPFLALDRLKYRKGQFNQFFDEWNKPKDSAHAEKEANHQTAVKERQARYLKAGKPFPA